MALTQPVSAAMNKTYHATLSANIIFDKKQKKHFLDWQRHVLLLKPGSEVGTLPSATSYAAYQRWRRAKNDVDPFSALGGPSVTNWQLGHGIESRPSSDRNSWSNSLDTKSGTAYPFRTAPACKHALHPAAPIPGMAASLSSGYSSLNMGQRDVEMCPCCIIDAHLKYMTVLQQAVDRTNKGEPCPWGTDTEHDNAVRAWHAGKAHMLQTCEVFERTAQNEREWEVRHPSIDLEGVMSAAKALRTYDLHIASLEVEGSRTNTPSLTSSRSTSPAMRSTDGSFEDKTEKSHSKRVSFDSNTSFDPSRPQIYFRIGSPRYDGKYVISPAASDDEVCYDEEGDGDEAVEQETDRFGNSTVKGTIVLPHGDWDDTSDDQRESGGSSPLDNMDVADRQSEESSDSDVNMGMQDEAEARDRKRQKIDHEVDNSFIVFGDDGSQNNNGDEEVWETAMQSGSGGEEGEGVEEEDSDEGPWETID